MFTLTYFLAEVGKRFMSTYVKPTIVFVLGGPGAGKGTQCERIVKEFGYIHLSAGDLLRQERASGSKDGDLIESYIRDGKIVPVQITISLIEKAMNTFSTKKFLIDGFPRNEDNLQGWNERMHDKVDFKFVLFFDCPEEVCVNRIMERAKSSGRSDDNHESLKKRFQTYKNDTMVIIKYYEERGLVRSIDASGSPDEVFEVVQKLFS